MSLQSEFEMFRKNIEPTANQKEQLVSSHVHLRQNILHRLNYISNTILTGSYKRNTQIRPLNDVDVFAVLTYTNPSNFYTPTPQVILNSLIAFLSFFRICEHLLRLVPHLSHPRP